VSCSISGPSRMRVCSIEVPRTITGSPLAVTCEQHGPDLRVCRLDRPVPPTSESGEGD
jgi:hypothetical protein